MTDAERYAQEFLDAADAIGQAITRVEGLTYAGGLNGEENAADTVAISGPELQEALRRIAMRLDRSAYLNRALWQNQQSERRLENFRRAVKRVIDLSPAALDTSELEEALATSGGRE